MDLRIDGGGHSSAITILAYGQVPSLPNRLVGSQVSLRRDLSSSPAESVDGAEAAAIAGVTARGPREEALPVSGHEQTCPVPAFKARVAAV